MHVSGKVLVCLWAGLFLPWACVAQTRSTPNRKPDDPKVPQASENASLPQPETALRWLQEKLRSESMVYVEYEYTGSTTTYVFAKQDLSFERCMVEYKFNWEERTDHGGGDGLESLTQEVVRFDLGGLASPPSVQSYKVPFGTPKSQMPWIVELGSFGEQKPFHLETSRTSTIRSSIFGTQQQPPTSHKNDLKDLRREFAIKFSSEDIARRAAAALTDAVRACGGVKEAY